MSIQIINIKDSPGSIDSVLDLHRKYSRWLGMLPRGAFESYAADGNILIAIIDNACVGYLLFYKSRLDLKITHLCVDSSYQRKGVASSLFQALLRKQASGVFSVKLTCRQDWPATQLWERLAFRVVGEKVGRGKERALLNIWQYEINLPPLLRMMKPKATLVANRAVIDSNIFFDICDSNRPSHEESSSLEADWLIEVVEICVTSELYNEIRRGDNRATRDQNRAHADRYTHINASHESLTRFRKELVEVLGPAKTANDKADIRQLAYTISAGIPFFVTRDRAIHSAKKALKEKFELEVVRPTELIVQLDQIEHGDRYSPNRFGGTTIDVRSPCAEEIGGLVSTFQQHHSGEKKYVWERQIMAEAALPQSKLMILEQKPNRTPIATWAIKSESPTTRTIKFLRTSDISLWPTLGSQVLQDTIADCSCNNIAALQLPINTVPNCGVPIVEQLGFMLGTSNFVKPISSGIRSLIDLRALLNRLKDEELLVDYQLKAVLEMMQQAESGESGPAVFVPLQRLFWPTQILEDTTPCYIVPIRPHWAEALFDHKLAEVNLFGAPQRLMFSHENVYYCSARVASIIRAPGRLMWYVSNINAIPGSKAIRAVSRVEAVYKAPAKQLFKQFRHLGVYAWRDVLATARNDPNGHITAVHFANTELLPKPVAFQDAKLALEHRTGKSYTFVTATEVHSQDFLELYASARD